MADFNSRVPGCDDDCCEGERGKRGKRGHRGHRGHDGHDGQDGATGPTGFTGPAAVTSGGLLKFSGTVAPAVEGDTIVSFLEDYGAGVASFQPIQPVSTAPSYPVAVAHNLRNMAVNLLAGFIVPTGGLIVVELLQNGVPVPGFTITYAAAETGVKTVLAGPVAFAIGDTFDVRVSVSGLISIALDMSATVGIE